MRPFRLIVLCCLLVLPAVAQNAFYYSNVAAVQAPGNLERVVPNAAVVICNSPPISGTPCTNLATAYISTAGTTQCSANTPVIVPSAANGATTSSCSATADGAGNFGFFLRAATYAYYFQSGTAWKGPFEITVLAGGGGGGGGMADPGANGILTRTALNVTGIATSADVLGLWTGTCSLNTVLWGDGVCRQTGGPGTTNILPKYTNGAAGLLGNSALTDNGTKTSYRRTILAMRR